MRKKIFIGADHAGFVLKEQLKTFLFSQGYEVIDCGSLEKDTRVDYPDFAQMVCHKVLAENARGVLICGSGIGMSIAANRHKGIRAALCWNPEVAKLSRQQNDANILALGARVISSSVALSCLEVFLKTPFEGGRHQCRIQKMDTDSQ
ncbi:MAG: ribose 5-phosphate isomerase B [Alphaproteobacteria bacterium]